MRALNRKLLRDVWAMKGQAAAIALVMASGVGTFIMSVSTLDSLRNTQATFYRESRFADVFASLKRAPETLRESIAAIPGVLQAQTSVAGGANLEVPGYSDPVTARISSVPENGRLRINRLHLTAGRMIEAARENEVIVGDAFATPHGLKPGGHLFAIINGRRKRLDIAGIALSPEYIYQLPPGSMIPDFKSYGVLWMARRALESAYDMEGAFNEVALTLDATASGEEVVDRLDDLLRRYGGRGAYTRKDQISHRYLSEEFKQLKLMATMFPAIFLGVAAFLLNVVVSRLIATQRDQVAILKAFGYSNAAVVIHYLKFVLIVSLVGIAGGVALGAWMGGGMSNMYMKFYKFPYMLYTLRPLVVVTAGLISTGAALAGAAYSVIKAAMLPPAEAMQPAPPARYRRSFIEWLGLRRIAEPTRIIVRNIERRPVKSALSVLGVGFACAILVMGGFWGSAVDFMVNVQFKMAQREDMAVTFVEPTSRKAMFMLARLDGVGHVEPFRTVPATLRFEHRSYRMGVQGVPDDAVLRRLLDADLKEFEIPSDGVVLTDYLAKLLGIHPGDMLTVEALEGARPIWHVPVAGLVREYVGVAAYMRLDALNRLMREGNAISGVYLTADSRKRQEIYDELKEMPRVAGTAVREKALRNFYDTMAGQVLLFAFFNTLFAGLIAFGVVYNSARIAFSERSRELASLRVLGFTRAEISYILLGELTLLTLAGIPLGFAIGAGLSAFMVARSETDLFRIPLVLESGTYSFAATVILASALLSAYLIKRRLDRLDLVAVLKTKE